MNRIIGILLIAMIVIMVVYLGSKTFSGMRTEEVSFNYFELQIKSKTVKKIIVEGTTLTALPKQEAPVNGKFLVDRGKDNKNIREVDAILAYLDPDYKKDRFWQDLADWKKTDPSLEFDSRMENRFVQDVLFPIIPWIILIGLVWFLLFRQVRNVGGGKGVGSFVKSGARYISPDKIETRFNDFAGSDETKDEVKEIVEYLKNPKKFRKVGGRVPRGILLVGAPGCGKTLLAKAVAGEAEVPFYSMSGSEFVELYVGVGAARVRDLFQQAKKKSPCIVFLDEIDAVGRMRGSGLGGGHDEREQTLNQILVEMDGFDTDENIIIMAATNRPDILDPALLRPGRFDRHVYIPLPDMKGRLEILGVHSKKIKMDPAVDLSVTAKRTPGFSGADLEALLNEAAILAATENSEVVQMKHIEEAAEKVKFGRQKKSLKLHEEERKITAYHEAGHAVVGVKMSPYADPVHKVSIIPRGPALGVTMSLPDRDRYNYSKKRLLAQITVLFGGRVAEEKFFGDISTGAADDIKQATKIARMMITEWGMSDALGPIQFQDSEEHMFLGREIARTKSHSEETANEIDAEIKKLIMQCYSKAKEIIEQNDAKITKVAQLLLEKETVTGDEIRAILEAV